MNNKKVLATLSALLVTGAGLTTLVNAQTVTGTVTNGTGSTTSRPQRQQLTDAQKAIMDQAKTLFDAGKADEAKALLTANGINFPVHGGKGHGRMGDMRKIDEAIANGDYATFQTLASTSPFKSISQDVFNQLTPQFKAKQAAEAQIKSILTSAGVNMPGKGPMQGTTTTN